MLQDNLLHEGPKTIRCEVSRIDHPGCMDSMFLQMPEPDAYVGREFSIGNQTWRVTAVDSGCDHDLYQQLLVA